jgi:hypothetical protein
MRQESPTGAAVGNVSNFEDKLLGSLKGSLDQKQSEGQLVTNLNRIRNFYHGASQHRITPENADYFLRGGSFIDDARDALAKGRVQRGPMIDELLRMGVDPALVKKL